MVICIIFATLKPISKKTVSYLLHAAFSIHSLTQMRYLPPSHNIKRIRHSVKFTSNPARFQPLSLFRAPCRPSINKHLQPPSKFPKLCFRATRHAWSTNKNGHPKVPVLTSVCLPPRGGRAIRRSESRPNQLLFVKTQRSYRMEYPR
jgi:hypothetical protein